VCERVGARVRECGRESERESKRVRVQRTSMSRDKSRCPVVFASSRGQEEGEQLKRSKDFRLKARTIFRS